MSRILYYIALFVWAFGASIPLFCMSTNAFFRGNSKRNFYFWTFYNRMFCRLFFRIRFELRENLDAKQQYIFLPNHHLGVRYCPEEQEVGK